MFDTVTKQETTHKNTDLMKELFTGHVQSDSKVMMRVSNLGNQPYLLLNDPVLIKDFLLNKQKNYKKWFEKLFVDLLFEEGIFITSGEKWKL